MKRSLIATVLGATLVLTAGVTPASATVLVQNKQPMVQSATLEAYKKDGWSSLPDYHMEAVSPSEIFQGFTQEELNAKAQDGIWLYRGACTNTKSRWLLNWKGLSGTIGNTNSMYTGNLDDWNNDLVKAGFNCKYFDNSEHKAVVQEAKDYLDRGCLLSYPGHAGIIYGYAEKDGKTWFAYLDTLDAASGLNACKKWESEDTIHLGKSSDAIAKDLSVVPLNCTYNGKGVKVYMDKLGQYYYPVDFVRTGGSIDDDIRTKADNSIQKVNGASNTILGVGEFVNINNTAWLKCPDLKIVNGQIMLK